MIKFTKRRVLGGLVIAPIAAVLGQSAAVVAIDAIQKSRNDRRVARDYPDVTGNGAAIIYFSRSGNTEIMAREIAKAKGGRAFPVTSSDYEIGLWGWVRALRDARDRQARIVPATMDLSSYDTVYLGSPIWMYSPAPPLWEFVRNSDFTGRKVVLFNSMNSKFEQSFIDEFAALVRQRGGTFAGHMFIIRGRMTQQMSTEDFILETRNLVRRF